MSKPFDVLLHYRRGDKLTRPGWGDYSYVMLEPSGEMNLMNEDGDEVGVEILAISTDWKLYIPPLAIGYHEVCVTTEDARTTYIQYWDGASWWLDRESEIVCTPSRGEFKSKRFIGK